MRKIFLDYLYVLGGGLEGKPAFLVLMLEWTREAEPRDSEILALVQLSPSSSVCEQNVVVQIKKKSMTPTWKKL